MHHLHLDFRVTIVVILTTTWKTAWLIWMTNKTQNWLTQVVPPTAMSKNSRTFVAFAQNADISCEIAQVITHHYSRISLLKTETCHQHSTVTHECKIAFFVTFPGMLWANAINSSRSATITPKNRLSNARQTFKNALCEPSNHNPLRIPTPFRTAKEPSKRSYNFYHLYTSTKIVGRVLLLSCSRSQNK